MSSKQFDFIDHFFGSEDTIFFITHAHTHTHTHTHIETVHVRGNTTTDGGANWTTSQRDYLQANQVIIGKEGKGRKIRESLEKMEEHYNRRTEENKEETNNVKYRSIWELSLIHI